MAKLTKKTLTKAVLLEVAADVNVACGFAEEDMIPTGADMTKAKLIDELKTLELEPDDAISAQTAEALILIGVTVPTADGASEGIARDALVSAAEDLSEACELKEAIDTTVDDDTLKADILEVATDVMEEGDEISDSTREVIDILKADSPEEEKPADPDPEPEEKKDPAPKPTAPKTGATMTRMDAAVEVFKAGNVTSVKDAAKQADALYAKSGGKGNEKESRWATKVVVNVLCAAELMTVIGDNITDISL